MKVCIVGLGLIGGSMALDLKASGFASSVVGVDENAANRKEAQDLNLVDEVSDLIPAVKAADFVILAIPVSAITKILPTVLDLIPSHATVTDVGSTKALITKSVENHPKKKNFVPSHPMAGTEFSGPRAAHHGLFKSKAAVICDSELGDPHHISLVSKMYGALDMRVITMGSEQHDLHAAYVSHLSHISSFVLANTVLDKEKDVDAIFNLASAGFESTVRLAKSSPDMWAPIFDQNQPYIVEALGEYIERLKSFHQSLVNRDFQKTKTYMADANKIRRVLEQIQNRGKT